MIKLLLHWNRGLRVKTSTLCIKAACTAYTKLQSLPARPHTSTLQETKKSSCNDALQPSLSSSLRQELI